MYGYHGQYLHVDLTAGVGKAVSLDESTLRSFLGGSGLGTFLLLKHQAFASDPLAAAAPLVFAFSPLVGSPLTTSAKFAVVCKSPLTDRINDSLASSGFALAGKKTGFDAILITGRAHLPSVLVIDGDIVSMEPAADVWGDLNDAAGAKLKARFGPQFKSATIGPGGENLVRFATISHDGRHAGRGGSGAVMGSKNLKAVLVRGQRMTAWAEPGKLVAYARELSKKSFGPATAKYRELGTATNLLVFNRLNCLPTRNFQQSSFENAEALSPEMLAVTREKSQESCVACTIGCEHIYQLNGKNGSRTQQVRLEYENLFALGPLCGVGDPQIVLEASKLCDEYGLDTISAGGTIAFAMECQQRSLIESSDLQFGNGAALLQAIARIGTRQGFGDQLAEGSRRLAHKIGGGAIDFAAQVKGLELPGYEPRNLQTMALGFAVGTRGADHNRSGAYEADFSDQVNRKHLSVDSSRLAIATENKAALMDSLILCKFLRGVFTDFSADAAEILSLVTGWNIDASELDETAERIVSAKKLFNIRCGWTPAEDTLPTRFFEQTTTEEFASSISQADMQAAIRAYNLARGWTADGHLGPAILDRLKLAAYTQ